MTLVCNLDRYQFTKVKSVISYDNPAFFEPYRGFKDRPVIDKGVEFAVFAARVDVPRQFGQELFVILPA